MDLHFGQNLNLEIIKKNLIISKVLLVDAGNFAKASLMEWDNYLLNWEFYGYLFKNTIVVTKLEIQYLRSGHTIPNGDTTFFMQTYNSFTYH